jgi:putative peptidoglycan lipid II flippase
MLPQGIFAMALGTAAFPTLSELVARDERPRMAQVTSETLRLVFYLAIPAGIAMFILREPLIELLFQRGRFTAASTQATAWVLQFYAPGLFAHAGVEILSRAFYALHDTRTPVAVGSATIALNVALSLALVGAMRQGGLALANTLATALEVVVLVSLLKVRLEGMRLEEISMALLRDIAAGAVMGLGMVALLRLAGGLPSAVLVGVGLLLGAAVYVTVGWMVRCAESRAIGQVVRSLGRPG